MNAIISLIALGGGALAVLGIGLIISLASSGRSVRWGIVLTVFGAVIGVIFMIVNMGLIEIRPNQVAVVFRRIGGGETALRATPLRSGLNWIIPFIEEATLYDISKETITMAGTQGSIEGRDQIQARTSDQQEVFLDVSVTISIDPGQVNEVHRTWQKRYINELVTPLVRTRVRDAIGGIGVEDVLIKREELQQDVQKTIAEELSDEGITLSAFLIRKVTFSTEYSQAVEQKQIADQRRQQAEQESERLRIQAKGEADAQKTRAQGEADAILIRAEAEAEALKLLNAVLGENPALIQWRYIDELADNISMILLPSNSPFLFDLQTLMEQAEVTLPETSAIPETTGSNGTAETAEETAGQ
jgi:regulator of protease activity HflC (stomatin/prohibitin superfamily)